MKTRLAKKIMKHRPQFVYGEKQLCSYWGYRMFLYDFAWRKDHRITKAKNLTSTKNCKQIEQ